jgi:hypothetical protein
MHRFATFCPKSESAVPFEYPLCVKINLWGNHLQSCVLLPASHLESELAGEYIKMQKRGTHHRVLGISHFIVDTPT